MKQSQSSWDDIRHFNKEEFACPCCGKDDIDMDFVNRLDEARNLSGIAYKINSGVRCEKHNKEVGSTSRNHLDSKAADISALTGYVRGRILRGLYGAGFRRIGISKTFIHVDSMDRPASCWLY